MTQASRYAGLPVSEGVAAGQLYQGDTPPGETLATPEGVAAAFATVARERTALAERLRAGGRGDEADIVAIGALIAADPALVGPAVAAAREGTGAAAAIEQSAAAQVAALSGLASPDLAARADDVRQVANAVLARLAGAAVPALPDGPFILVRREVDPVDLIRFADAGLAGAVSVAGGASSHAAIIARGLGLPMLAGVDPAVLTAPAGHPAVLDAVAGRLVVDPSPGELAAAGPVRARANGVARPAAPARTADGQEITLLCNVASAAETRLGLAAGAAGVGLLRTEIPFTGAAGWPSEAEHRSALDPVLRLLAGRPAVVRLLDFTGDKIPPFLADQEPGLAALLSHPRALADQLRAVLRSGRDAELSLMVPMVRTVAELAAVRAALAEAAADTGAPLPELGMMVEVAATAAAAGAFTGACDFFSVGTNDLTSEVLGLDRADPAMSPTLAADPQVLALIATVATAAQSAGVGLSVCGDAAADPAVLPLLIGLGIRRFSVGAARLPQVAEWIAAADSAACATRASRALAEVGLAPLPDQPPRAAS
jgi:phosphoenolpyruvate-protein kinase (PTS system EI component)